MDNYSSADRAGRSAHRHARASYSVLRYEAPLARLLGLPAQLAALAGGRAKHWTALSHYALATGGGPGGRAA